MSKKTEIKNIAILTSGGDSPGMNAAVRAVAKKAKKMGITPYLVWDGFKGLVEGNITKCDFQKVDSSLKRGGTFIFSARFPEFSEVKYQKIAVENLEKHNIQALVVIGGDGSYRGAQALSRHGVLTIGLPGTIDNDIVSSDYTIGFFTALDTIVEASEKINDTSHSHHRVIVIEVMGRGCGDLAAYASIALTPIITSTPESKKTNAEIIHAVKKAFDSNSSSNIVVVSENLHDLDEMIKEISEKTGIVTRKVVLGHMQRGGEPTATDRILATLMGVKAVELLMTGHTSECVGYVGGEIISTDIEKALSLPRKSIKKMVDDINDLNEFMTND